jgi:hypothetical protein
MTYEHVKCSWGIYSLDRFDPTELIKPQTWLALLIHTSFLFIHPNVNSYFATSV